MLCESCKGAVVVEPPFPAYDCAVQYICMMMMVMITAVRDEERRMMKDERVHRKPVEQYLERERDARISQVGGKDVT